MTLPLADRADHPATIIKADLKADLHPAADYLLGHEDEHDGVFAFLPSAALYAVEDALRLDPADAVFAARELRRTVMALLGAEVG